MLSVNVFCNISSYDILAYITNNYIALIYYAKLVQNMFSLKYSKQIPNFLKKFEKPKPRGIRTHKKKNRKCNIGTHSYVVSNMLIYS